MLLSGDRAAVLVLCTIGVSSLGCTSESSSSGLSAGPGPETSGTTISASSGVTTKSASSATNTGSDSGFADDDTSDGQPDTVCGDGVTEGIEACDDSNTSDGDECSADCAVFRREIPLGVYGVTYDHARDAQGTIHALWKSGGTLRYGTLVDGAIVGAEDIPSSNGSNIRFKRPRIAVSPDGETVHTCWNGLPGVALEYARRDEDGRWTRQAVWQQPVGTQFVAVAAIGADLDGAVHIIAQRWDEGVTPSPVVYFRKPSAAEAWSAPQTIQAAEGKQWRDTSIFVDDLGGVHATWKTGARPGQYRSVASGGDLSAAATITIPTPPDPAIDTVSFGDLFVTAQADVHHVFVTYPLQQLWYEVRREDTGDFGEPSLVGPLDNDEALGYENPWPAVAVDVHGRVFASWSENRGGGTISHVVLATFDGQQWIRHDVTNSADIDVNSAPAMTVVDDLVHLVYSNLDGEQVLVQYRYSPPAG